MSAHVGDGWQVEFELSNILCNITIKLFRDVSKIGHADRGHIHARFAAWRSRAMSIKSSALETTRRVVLQGASLKRNS